jgi:hypothetical protein
MLVKKGSAMSTEEKEQGGEVGGGGSWSGKNRLAGLCKTGPSGIEQADLPLMCCWRPALKLAERVRAWRKQVLLELQCNSSNCSWACRICRQSEFASSWLSCYLPAMILLQCHPKWQDLTVSSLTWTSSSMSSPCLLSWSGGGCAICKAALWDRSLRQPIAKEHRNKLITYTATCAQASLLHQCTLTNSLPLHLPFSL